MRVRDLASSAGVTVALTLVCGPTADLHAQTSLNDSGPKTRRVHHAHYLIKEGKDALAENIKMTRLWIEACESNVRHGLTPGPVAPMFEGPFKEGTIDVYVDQSGVVELKDETVRYMVPGGGDKPCHLVTKRRQILRIDDGDMSCQADLLRPHEFKPCTRMPITSSMDLQAKYPASHRSIGTETVAGMRCHQHVVPIGDIESRVCVMDLADHVPPLDPPKVRRGHLAGTWRGIALSSEVPNGPNSYRIELDRFEPGILVSPSLFRMPPSVGQGALEPADFQRWSSGRGASPMPAPMPSVPERRNR